MNINIILPDVQFQHLFVSNIKPYLTSTDIVNKQDETPMVDKDRLLLEQVPINNRFTIMSDPTNPPRMDNNLSMSDGLNQQQQSEYGSYPMFTEIQDFDDDDDDDFR